MPDWGLFFVTTFIGSALGGWCRYLISGYCARRCGDRFPVGTMMVNVTGAFFIGLVWAVPWDEGTLLSAGVGRDFLMFGFLGGYTTVSSFAWNTLYLVQNRQWGRAVLNLFGSWFFCLAAVYAGVAVGGGLSR
jgi:fluoride exporter